MIRRLRFGAASRIVNEVDETGNGATIIWLTRCGESSLLAVLSLIFPNETKQPKGEIRRKKTFQNSTSFFFFRCTFLKEKGATGAIEQLKESYNENEVQQTWMCFMGLATSLPPACFTNSAGVRKLPWHTHTMQTCPFMYLYKNPSTFLPFGPSPIVVTLGIVRITSIPPSPSINPFETLHLFAAFVPGFSLDAVVCGSLSIDSSDDCEVDDPLVDPTLPCPVNANLTVNTT